MAVAAGVQRRPRRVGSDAAEITSGTPVCRQLTEGVLVSKPDRKSGKDFKPESDTAPLTF